MIPQNKNRKMKVSVATYRASAERLTSMRRAQYGAFGMTDGRRGSSLDSGSERLLMSGHEIGDQNLEHLRSVTFSDPLRVHALDLSFRREHPLDTSAGPFDGTYTSRRLENQPCLSSLRSKKSLERRHSPPATLGVSPLTRPSVAMMVDGSPRRVQVAAAPANTSPHGDPLASSSGNGLPRGGRDKRPSGDELVIIPSGISTGVKGRLAAQDSVGGEGAASASSPANDPGGTGGRSRWLKLRTTVQLSGAITHVNRKHPLKREDSFLTRFSTRQIHDPASSGAAPRSGGMWGDYGSSSNGGEGGLPRPWYSIFTTVFNPDENALFMWLWILTGCVLYNAWTLIVRQAFPELQSSAPLLWYSTDIFSDIIYILDIMVQFRTGYLEQGMMVCDAKKLTGHYARSKMFLMDLLALTPLDLIQFTVGPFPLLRFPRFIKVYRSYRFYYMVESRTIYPNLWRVVNLIHILLLLAHWFGCFYYMLSEVENFQGSWSYPSPHGNWSFLTRKYLGSVYWSTLTLTTIGDLATPATNLQYIFTIVSYLIGVFVFATIVGQVGNVITNRNASRLEFERLLDGAKLYMRHHKVPHNMQRRVQRWYDYSWSRGRMQGGGDINSALGILPDKLKTELALHVNLKTLKKVTIFQECQPEFLHDLVLKMKAYIFTPGDMICRKGEVAREMFIIADGILEVISESGKVLTQMKAGDFFGEIGILNLDGFNRRTADVCSVGYSELFSLSREDVLAAMKDYPEAQEILQTMGRKRLMEARLAAVASKRQDETSAASSPGALVASGQGKDGSSAGGSFKSKESGRKLKPTMLKLKKDVQNLQRLLRSKTGSSDSKTELTAETQLEMAALHDDKSLLSEAGSSSCGRTQLVGRRIHRLLSKIHSRSDSITSQTTKESVITTTITNEPKPIGEGLPFLERIKLLRQIELAKAAAEAAEAAKEGDVPVVPPAIKPPPPPVQVLKPAITVAKPLTSAAKPSFKLLAGSMAGKGAKPKIPSPETEKQPDVSSNPNANENSDVTSVPSTCEKRVPLLKKVLLKVRDEPSAEVKTVTSASVKATEKLDESSNSKISETKVCDKKPFSQELTKSNLANFNGQKHPRHLPISPLATVSKPAAKSCLKSPLIITPELMKAATEEGYAARRTRLVRMHAFEIDSADDSEASGSSTESQIEVSSRRRNTVIQIGPIKQDAGTNVSPRATAEAAVQATSPVLGPHSEVKKSPISDEDSRETPRKDFLSKQGSVKGRRSSCGDGLPIKRCDSPTEALLESYFSRVMKCMKQVLKTYLDETQRDLHRQITSLQTQLEEKSLLINELQEALKVQDRSVAHSLASGSTFLDDVTSLSSLLSSVSGDFSSTDTDSNLDDDDDNDGELGPRLEPSNERSQSIESSSHHSSWPSGLAQAAGRKKTNPTWQPFSWDEETNADESQFTTEDLWRTEFPPISAEPDVLDLSPSSLTLPSPSSLASRPPAPNDWEIRMLVEEFDKKRQEQRLTTDRRHSYGDHLWKHRSYRSTPSHGRLSAPSLSSVEHFDTGPTSRDAKVIEEPTRSVSFFTRRGPKLASCRRRSLPHFSFSSGGSVVPSSTDRVSFSSLSSRNQRVSTMESGAVSSPNLVSSSKKVSFFQRKRFSLSDISAKRRSSVGGSSGSVGFYNTCPSTGTPDSSQFQPQSTNVPREKQLPSTRNVSGKNSDSDKLVSSPSLPKPTRVPENNPRRSSSSYALVAISASQSLLSPESAPECDTMSYHHHSREGFSSLHCLPTITEDDVGSPSVRRLGHSQSFSEDLATSYGELVNIGEGCVTPQSSQPIILHSRTPSSDTPSDRMGDASDSAEDTPLVSTIGASVAISIPEYQPLLSPP